MATTTTGNHRGAGGSTAMMIAVGIGMTTDDTDVAIAMTMMTTMMTMTNDIGVAIGIGTMMMMMTMTNDIGVAIGIGTMMIAGDSGIVVTGANERDLS